MKKDVVTRTAGERDQLAGMIAAGTAAARKLAHARIRLKADAADGGPGWADGRAAEAVEVRTSTADRVRGRPVEDGSGAALSRKTPAKPSRERVPDGAAEAKRIAPACPPPPGERARWTLRMRADTPVELAVVAAVATETVRRVRGKASSSRTGRSRGASRAGRAGSSSPGWGT